MGEPKVGEYLWSWSNDQNLGWRADLTSQPSIGAGWFRRLLSLSSLLPSSPASLFACFTNVILQVSHQLVPQLNARLGGLLVSETLLNDCNVNPSLCRGS